MKPLQLTSPLQAKIIELAQVFQKQGGRGLLVGGCVRDMLWGVAPKDYDLEVYGISPEALHELVAQFGPVDEVGRSFGILKLRVEDDVIDIALPRKDSKISAGHRGFSIQGDPYMSFEEATRRRDFTMNALLLDPLTGELIDPWQGQKDVTDKLLKIVDEQFFADDPLRVLRAMQLVARFDLTVDEQSLKVMRKMAPSLNELPRERIGGEWQKLLLDASVPSKGLWFALDVGLAEVLHPEVRVMRDTPQEPEWHPEGDVFTHSTMVVDEAAKIVRRERLDESQKLIVMLGALCHDLGKPLVTRPMDGRIRSIGHEESGEAPTRAFLKELAVGQDVIEKVVGIVKDHLKPYKLYDSEVNKGEMVTDGALRRLAQRISPATMQELNMVAEADYLGRGPFPDNKKDGQVVNRAYPTREWFIHRATVLDIANQAPAHLIRGQDLLAFGFTPSPLFGEIVKLADDLRDDRAMTKEQVFELIRGTKTAEEAVDKLKP